MGCKPCEAQKRALAAQAAQKRKPSAPAQKPAPVKQTQFFKA